MDTNAIIDAAASHAMTLGLFERVNKHEPKNAPGNGLTCAIWGGRITPINSSGLASTSVRLLLNVRLYSSMLQEPADMIDPNLTAACDTLMAAYAGDLTLGAQVRTVDVRGIHGVPMEAVDGYLSQDNRLYRVYTITLPLLINDAWTEAP